MKKLLIMATLAACSSLSAGQAKIVAHRGDNSFAPENSVESAKIAWSNGVKFVEGDFYECAAGMICLHGKYELKKLAGVETPIKDISAADLKKINLAANDKWREKFAGTQVRLPLMKEIFATVPKDGVLVFEMKSYSPTYAKAVDDAREAAGLKKSQILLIAFDADSIKDFNSKYAGYKSLWLYSPKIVEGRVVPTAAEAIAKCAEIGASGVDVGNTGILGADYVGEIKRAGLDFAVWTVNDFNELKRMELIGVDYVTTDFAGDFVKKQKAQVAKKK